MNQPGSRFTLDGSIQLEARIAELCQSSLAAVEKVIPPNRLEGMILGGGYGRGEGGVLHTPHGELPYNDLEFYICVKGYDLINQRRYGLDLHRIGEELSKAAGLDIEFKLFSFLKLRLSQISMFYYDLVAAHKWVKGNESLLVDCQHHRDSHRIPLDEATRLLMNRCSGLLFATQRIEKQSFGEEDGDFVARNIAKAKLALGDVVLVMWKSYFWSCRERHRRLLKICDTSKLTFMPEVLECHREGVEFKLHPYKSQESQSKLASSLTAIKSLAEKVWLWLEGRRLKKDFASSREYALSEIDRCPDTLLFKNVLLNLRTYGPGICAHGATFRYPRERLLRTLPLLLWTTGAVQKPDLLAHIQTQLRTSAATFPEIARAYQSLWSHYN